MKKNRCIIVLSGIRPKCKTNSDMWIGRKCPNCGYEDKTKMSVVRRVCGYTTELALRKTIDNKMKEINHRKNHGGV